ncbi:hypothetical protein Riv7116_6927 (plasmid) [Rivularia sp. PCC 7116]|uniref:hypothetical protein n=1 Tax=Rivularia sp. PCC 7116 TaxID=373994 RepID=UPI00029EE223|nr:hypothetical protein [Rivularia sp. PCC 7116]AFY59239.1 hypothetical protein Riv7116_6927 [Rivularia sp. PCC 7116]
MLKRFVAFAASIAFSAASGTNTAYALEINNNPPKLNKKENEFVIAQGQDWIDKMLALGNLVINAYTIYQKQLEQRQQAQPQVKISKPYFGACGSLAPTSYPAVRYRIYINYSPAYFKAAKQHLCNDVWVISKAPHNGKKMIVISSFAEKHYPFAIKLAQLFKDKNIPGASVQRVVIRKL